jgi:hypothetical protein
VLDMVHAKVEIKPKIVLSGAGGLTVGDWVEVLHDFSPENNSGGGVGVITEIVENRSHVRYIRTPAGTTGYYVVPVYE